KLGQALSAPLRGPLGRRFGQTYPRHAWQHLLGRLREAGQRTGQANQLLSRWGKVASGQPQRLVPGAVATIAVRTVVVGPAQADLSQGTHDLVDLPPVELGRLVAMGTEAAGAVVPPFFRSWRAVSSALAPRRCTVSRSWNSVAPKSWSSGLAASRRARARRS